MLERDPDLLEYLENCRARSFEGAVYRVAWADKSPVQGSSGARGRWSSPDSEFEGSTPRSWQMELSRNSRPFGRCSSSGRTGRQ